MKLVFNDWVLTLVRDKSPRQWDSNEPFEVVGVPDGWVFKLYLAVCDNMDVINLEKTDNSVYTSLKREQLSFAGDYRFQLEGVNGETIRHTNIIHLNVPYSLDGNTHWPELPTAFRDALEKAEVLASTAVRYEAQDLNTEQQLQARENIGAEPRYGGLIRREISHTNIFGLATTSVFYTEQGSISPLPEDADVETKNQYALLMGMITGSIFDAGPSQWIKTAQIIVNFYKTDIIPVPVVAYSSVNRTAGLSVTRTGSNLWIRHFSTGSFNHVAYYNVEKGTLYDNVIFRHNVYALSYNVNNDLSTSGLNVPEPSKDTQPTPKSYVDKKVAEAVAAAGGHGLTLQTLTYTYVGEQQTRDVYIEKGFIAQPADDATDDIKTAFNYFCAYFTTETSSIDLKGYQRLCSLAITILDAGLISKDLCFYESPGRNMMFRIVELGSNYQIMKRHSGEVGGVFIAYYDIANKTFLDQGTVSLNVCSTSYNTDAPTVKNLKVNTPTDSLHATNKEYVDALVNDVQKYAIFEFTLNKDRTVTFDQYDSLKTALESGTYVLLKEKNGDIGRSSPLFTLYHESSSGYPRYYFSRIIWTLNDNDLKFEEITVRLKEPSSNYSMTYESNIIIPQALYVGKEDDGTYKVDLSVDYERRFRTAYNFLARVVSDSTYGSVVCRFYPKGLDDLDSVILHLSGDYVRKSTFEFIGASDTTLYKLTVDLDSNIAVTETPLQYTLPIATSEVLGGVKPLTKTEAMTQDVGVDENGQLFTAPSGADHSLGLTSATPGQIAKITAVDDNGKPTAWEPVDMPSGGGIHDVSWRAWDNVVVPEGGLNAFDFTTLASGEKLSDHQVKGMFIYSPYAVSAAENEQPATLTVNGDYVFSLTTFSRATGGYLRLLLTVESSLLIVRYYKRDTDNRADFPATTVSINKEDLHSFSNLAKASTTIIGYGKTLKLFNRIESVRIESSGQVAKNVEFDVQVLY